MSVCLVPVACPRCGQPLPARPEEIAFGCAACGQAARVDGDHLLEQAVSWAAPSAAPESWLPFWAFAGPVSFSAREARSGHASEDVWRLVSWLWVPAFSGTVSAARQWGESLTRSQPRPVPGPVPAGAPLGGCVLAPEDARKLARIVVLSIEAGRPDVLRSLAFTFPDIPPELWVLPVAAQQLVLA